MKSKTKKKIASTTDVETIDSDFDVRREANIAASHIRDTGRRVHAMNQRARQADERAMELEHDDEAEYGDVVRLGYVWAALVVIVTGLILATVWGVIPS